MTKEKIISWAVLNDEQNLAGVIIREKGLPDLYSSAIFHLRMYAVKYQKRLNKEFEKIDGQKFSVKKISVKI